CITAFGLRNFQDPEQVIKEIFRVTKRGGNFVIVEAVPPIKPAIRFLNYFYLTRLVPLIARLFSPNPSAYHYLAQSIAAFLPAPALNELLQKSGWAKTRYFPLLFGTTTVFEGIKP
ncbi:MAG: class I SAM-dependent methyltransferase, partial [Promethearchaeota archaeon]